MSEQLKTDPVKLDDISPAKERLLHVAIDLFYEKGFERTTVRDIAAKAGILSGSLFHHFKSKQEILFTAMALTTRAMGENAKEAVEGIDDPVEQLRALILSELSSIHRGSGHAAFVLVDEWRSLDEGYRDIVLAMRDESYERCWEVALEGCAQNGLLKADPRIVRQHMRGANAWTKNWFRMDGKLSLQGLADETLNSFLTISS